MSGAERGYWVTLAASMAQSVDYFEPMSFRRSGLEEVAEEYWVFDLLTLSPSSPGCLEMSSSPISDMAFLSSPA